MGSKEQTNVGERVSVCHFTHTFLHGGGTKRLISLLNGLDPKRFSTTLVVGREVDPEQLDILAHCIVRKILCFGRRIRPCHDLLTMVKLASFLKSGEYHVLNTHHAKPGVIGRVAGFLAGIPVIIHDIHGSTLGENYAPLTRFVNLFLEKCLSKITSVYVFVGADIRAEYLRKRACLAERTVIIRSGMDLTPFLNAKQRLQDRTQLLRSLGVPSEYAVIGMVSRFIKGKGHRIACGTIREVVRQYREVCFIFVGDGPLEGYWKERIAEQGMSEHVVFTGYRKDVADVMVAFDVGLFTSESEGLPQVLVQKAAVGMPIVTSDVNGAREVVAEGETGFIVKCQDEGLFTNQLTLLLRNACLRKRMGEKARERVREWATVEKLVSSTSKLYRRTINSHYTSNSDS